MNTSLATYKTQLTAAQSAYLAALQTLYGALIDLESLTSTVERCGGGPQSHFSANAMDSWQDLFTYLEHPTAAPRGTHFGGALVASAGTLTSSPTLTFHSVPSWVIAGLLVNDATTGTAIGKVSSTSSTTITLAANAANAVAAGDTLTLSFGMSQRIRDQITTATTTYINNWSGS